MSKVIVDPGPIVKDPGQGGPPEFVKVEFSEGWPSKWIGPGEALEIGNLSDDATGIVEIIRDQPGLDGLLLPAVQAARESLPQTFIKFSQEDFDAVASIAGQYEEFDDVVFLNPGAGGGDELQHKVQWGTFIKITDIDGESRDTPEMGAWTPLIEPDLLA